MTTVKLSSQVNDELDISPTSTQINMGASSCQALEVPSGAIAMSNLQGKSNAQFIVASGGSVSTVGDYKIHIFTSSSNFVVAVTLQVLTQLITLLSEAAAEEEAVADKLQWLVLGCGGGGFRESAPQGVKSLANSGGRFP